MTGINRKETAAVPHPSRRPIRRIERKSQPVWRVPDIGYTTPRLRYEEKTAAIGFTATDRYTSFEDRDK